MSVLAGKIKLPILYVLCRTWAGTQIAKDARRDYLEGSRLCGVIKYENLVVEWIVVYPEAERLRSADPLFLCERRWSCAK
jgi:hypothetical protein